MKNKGGGQWERISYSSIESSSSSVSPLSLSSESLTSEQSSRVDATTTSSSRSRSELLIFHTHKSGDSISFFAHFANFLIIGFIVCSASVESARFKKEISRKKCVCVCVRLDKDSLCLRYSYIRRRSFRPVALPSRISLFKVANKYLLHLPIFCLLLLMFVNANIFRETSVTVRYCD